MIEIVDALVALFTVLGILGGAFTWYINARMSSLNHDSQQKFTQEMLQLRELLFDHLDNYYMRRDLLEAKLERLRSPEVIDALQSFRLQIQLREKNILEKLDAMAQRLDRIEKNGK